MNTALLIDIGSTYTKVTGFDLDSEELIGCARALTTVEEDVTIGLNGALKELKDQGFFWENARYKLACSSAAGGLKMVALGLVPELTVEAAKRAALGAGARVLKVYSYQLTQEEMREIEELAPDIILLAGGTDGGNTSTIIHNARVLAESKLDVPVVVAGNKVAAPEVVKILKEASKDVRKTENVMPELEELNILPARETIRQVFLERIVKAKGLNRAQKIIDGVVMPTPAAVLRAAGLLARGVENEDGLGEILIVDVGGATTDVHSAAEGEPSRPGVTRRGLKEPFLKRTVEGDLGMRYSSQGIFKALDSRSLYLLLQEFFPEQVEKNAEKMKERFEQYVQKVSRKVEYLPLNQEEKIFDRILGRSCVEIAVRRHAGTIKTIYTPFGATYLQYGKDLTGIPVVVGTGGVIINHSSPLDIMKGALFSEHYPEMLVPVKPRFLIDREYILASTGLLSEVEPVKALRIVKKYLQPIG